MEKGVSKNKSQSFFHNLFYKTVVVSVSKEDNKTPLKTIEKKRSLTPIWIILVLAVIIGCLMFILSNYSGKFQLYMLGDIISKLFVPSKWSLKTYDAWWNYMFTDSIPKIWDTVEMVFIATILGSLVSVPFYYVAAGNIVKNKVVNNIVRFIVNLLRTLPTYVLAIIGAIFFGFGEAAGIFAMQLFTFGIMFKLMYEYVETCDMNPYEVSLSNGATKIQAYAISIHPQVMPMFLSNVIYTFEINIRASVVLGFVGAGGIGQTLSDAMESTSYDKIGAILIPLFIVVFTLQLISSYVRRKVS